MKRLFPVLLMVLMPLPVRAALDAETNKGYEVEVVVRCGSHSWLGEQFRDDLRSDLTGILKDALAGMAEVRVIDLKKVPPAEWKPLWRDVELRGFAALDSAQDLTGVKTHFVRIDFIDGQYVVQGRQHDGSTGLVSTLRRDQTVDRALVTRLAARMIGQDFGIVGTVTGRGREGTVTFKAGALGQGLDRWVHKGDVFALFKIYPPLRTATAKADRAFREPDSLVQVLDEPKNGAAPCRVIQRGAISLLDQPAPGVLGYRCIRIASTLGPVRLRLVDDRGQPHTRTLQIRVHGTDFQKGESPEEEVLNPDRNGIFLSKRNYENLSFVRIVTGARQIAQAPVEILGDRPVTMTVGLSPETEQAGQLQYQHAELLRGYQESELVHWDRRKEINAMVSQGKNREALDRAYACRTALDQDMRRLAEQMTALRKEIGDLPISLADCEKTAKDLEKWKRTFNQLVGQLEEWKLAADDPARKETERKLKDLHTQAKARIDSFDFDGAIELLKQIVTTKEFGDQPSVQKELADLMKAWEVKSAEHKAARDYVYKDWALSKTSGDVETKLPALRKNLQVLVQVKDELTLLKLRATMVEVGKVLAEEIQSVKANPDDADKTAKLKKVGEDFEKFGQELEAAIEGKAPKG